MGKKDKADKTKISVDIETVERLMKLKHVGDSYSDVVDRLLDHWDKGGKKK